MDPASHAQAQGPARPQFGVSALLWTTAAVALALAYLRGFGAGACVAGFEIAALALVLGLLLGKATGRMALGVFWSIVGGMFGYLSAAGAPVFDPAIRYAWGLVGCAAAAVVAVSWPQHLYRSLVLGAVAGGVMMLAVLALPFFWGMLPPVRIWRFDALCAPAAGAWMGLAVVAVEWADRRTPTPRYISGAGLMLAVIAGNLAGAALFPWWSA